MSFISFGENDSMITQSELDKRWRDSNLEEYTRNFSMYEWMSNQGDNELSLIFITRKQVLIIPGPKKYIDYFGQEKGLSHNNLLEIAEEKTNMIATYPIIAIKCVNTAPKCCIPLSYEDNIGCTDRMIKIVGEIACQAQFFNEEQKRSSFESKQKIEFGKNPHPINKRRLKTPRSEDDSNERICGVPLDEFYRILIEQNAQLERTANDNAVRKKEGLLKIIKSWIR